MSLALLIACAYRVWTFITRVKRQLKVLLLLVELLMRQLAQSKKPFMHYHQQLFQMKYLTLKYYFSLWTPRHIQQVEHK